MRRIPVQMTLLIVISCSSAWLWSWGERGHHIVASTAARLVAELAPPTELGSALGRFFGERSIMMGHLSNIPDISWRSPTNRRVSSLNSPHHYFGPERVLGPPAELEGPSFERYLQRVRNEIPADYAALKATSDGSDNALPGVPPGGRRLLIYEDFGVTPWRTQELYDLLVEAFKCAKKKEAGSAEGWTPAYGPVESPFRQPESGEASQIPLPSYVCSDGLPRRADLYAAVVVAGIMAHFIGDQVQPYHPTADYDGWVTGNGGIHAYFESEVVRGLDPLLARDVLTTALDPEFRKASWDRVGTELNQPWGVARLLIHVGVDALEKKNRVRRLDDEVAIQQRVDDDGAVVAARSARLPWGDHPMFHSEDLQAAERIPADSPSVSKAFRPLVVERLATSAVVLATTWVSAWKEAGEPALMDQNPVTLPYPVDPPFIWPAFDGDALERSLRPRRSLLFPSHWWDAVPVEGAPDWEVLPQAAGPGEVILSKRHELGLLSNFAPTPITLRGRQYASVEGLWQMMKYPEGPDDPRSVFPGLEWPHTREEVARMTGFEAKEAGDLASENMRKMDIDWVTFEGRQLPYWVPEKGAHYQLIVEAMWQKLRQNPEVEKALLSTGDLSLRADYHQNAGDPPAWFHNKIWMEIRDQLRKEQAVPPGHR